jgi:ATP-dependent protease ClpP protease subunit
MDYIRTLTKKGINIETIAYGFCASAATFLLLAGNKRLMGENSFILIHQLSVEGNGGCYAELMADMKINKKLMKHFRKVYTKYTNIPEDVLEKLMSKDVILSADKCLSYSIVDEII